MLGVRKPGPPPLLQAMNRNLANVILGGYGAGTSAARHANRAAGNAMHSSSRSSQSCKVISGLHSACTPAKPQLGQGLTKLPRAVHAALG